MPAIARAVIRARGERSAPVRLASAGPLRLLAPRRAGRAAWLVTSSLGGGLVDGDDVELAVDVEAGATCVITTQASTKAYRGAARQRLAVALADDAVALVVPDPLVPYRDATITSITEIARAPSASVVVLDTLTAGRVAHGERWGAARVDATLAIAPLLHDRVVLDRAHGSIARRLGAYDALATCVLLGPRVAPHAAAILADIAARPLDPACTIAASPLGDGAIVRVATRAIADAIAITRALLRPACLAVGEDPWARKY